MSDTPDEETEAAAEEAPEVATSIVLPTGNEEAPEPEPQEEEAAADE